MGWSASESSSFQCTLVGSYIFPLCSRHWRAQFLHREQEHGQVNAPLTTHSLRLLRVFIVSLVAISVLVETQSLSVELFQTTV